jgi:hypothetical protein
MMSKEELRIDDFRLTIGRLEWIASYLPIVNRQSAIGNSLLIEDRPRLKREN